jgi:dihydroxyacid dehydratase/phosphogluconate dehydratase
MAFQTEKLSSKDLELIEEFFHRRLSLDATVRENMARKIAVHVSDKLNEHVPADAQVEDFLQAVAKAIRDNG